MRNSLDYKYPLGIMPIFRTALICFCLVHKAAFSSGLDLENWFLSPSVQPPIRAHELEGDKIVEALKVPAYMSFIYPESVSIFQHMDASLKRFYTLKELVSTPGLAPVHPFHSTANLSKNSLKNIPVVQKNWAGREKKAFDASLLLVPQNHAPLPSDEQLTAFLEEGRKNFIPPTNPAEIIDKLLSNQNIDHPVISLLNDSPDVRRALKSETFNQGKNGLFNSANLALNASRRSPPPEIKKAEVLPKPPALMPLTESVAKLKPDASTSLKLKANKPSRDGSLRPAQASEIYLTTQDLKELLQDLTKDPAVAGEVRSVAELWAKAEKNVSQNPEVALGVKSILLSAKVGRARTDPYGQASLENLSPDDKYYVIGIDKDVDTNVVTIWSKEVEVAPGENLVELTSTDVIYQE